MHVYRTAYMYDSYYSACRNLSVSFNLYPIEQQVIESKSHRSFGQDFQKNNKGNIPFIRRCWHMIYEPNAKTNCILTLFMSCTFCENPWCPWLPVVTSPKTTKKKFIKRAIKTTKSKQTDELKCIQFIFF